MKKLTFALLIACVIAMSAVTVTVQADSRDYQDDRRYDQRGGHGKQKKSHPHHGHHYKGPRYVRPYRHPYPGYRYPYPGYGYYFPDNDAYKWLSFTAIAIKLLDNFNEQQRREFETAQVRAMTTPIGETIYWNEGNASGQVTATRDGTSSSGRYCREFQHVVTIGGKREQSYGTACRQPDGSWKVISTGQ